LPEIRIVDLPGTLPPASTGPTVAVEIGRPYALPLDGRITLTVDPETGSLDAAVNRADPRVRFLNGQTQARFTIPAGSTRAPVPFGSTGTVASTVAFAVSDLKAGGVVLPVAPPPKSFRVARSAPVLTDACFAPGATGIEIVVTGYSTTRQLDWADLTVSPPTAVAAAGGAVRVNLNLTAGEYYASDDSVRFGSAFTLRFPLAIQGGGAGVTSVALTLTNAVGSSSSRQAGRCP
jgi:hypothetical protein